MREIRDRVNRILDRLDDSAGREALPAAADREVSAITDAAGGMALQNGRAEGKEFDPLQGPIIHDISQKKS